MMETYQSPEQSQEKRQARMSAASREFAKASELAESKGLRLLRKSDVHYQLMPQNDSWLLNVYPSNRRLYRDPNRGHAPHFRLPARWTLFDVVKAAKAGGK